MSAGLLLRFFYRILSGFIGIDYAAEAFCASLCKTLFAEA
ncbi:hypothetical protein GCWU000325_02535 [Alloprevotella tannerae ATCC 51259]|uniref:Uncharacterized protein n=1 Tax=Alloprevotella tannerae ATCC 51259 TaxID=626522 RepID=C9LJX1_9BACT|nr:hypothetical protein GCWU000325_02535 [Alloprevotella tannerae ATCC 51259]